MEHLTLDNLIAALPYVVAALSIILKFLSDWRTKSHREALRAVVERIEDLPGSQAAKLNVAIALARKPGAQAALDNLLVELGYKKGDSK